MGYVFALGLLFGLRHALDADHIAAVAAIATRARSARETLRLGIAWGVGHALTLCAVCAVALAAGAGVSDRLAAVLECLVGVMLIGLGADVLRRVIRDRMRAHAHAHRHAGEDVHLHVHAHAGNGDHAGAEHAHRRGPALTGRALAVGLMHGLAGSAALLLLSAGTMETAALALAYVALFGLGSVLGMAALSLTIALPLQRCTRLVTWGSNGVHVAIGTATVALGTIIVSETAGAAAALLSAG